MEKAIKLALEGGWREDILKGYRVDESQKASHKNACVLVTENSIGQTFIGYEINHNDALIDPSFWRALGKSLGWWENTHTYTKDESFMTYIPSEWRRQWHSFIEHLAEGRDAESFFNSLIK